MAKKGKHDPRKKVPIIKKTLRKAGKLRKQLARK